MGQNPVTILKFNLEHCVWQGLDDYAFLFDC